MDSLDAILSRLNPKRLEHSRRVSEASLELAKAHGFSTEDQERVRLAGLLHDIARHYSPEELLAMAERYGIAIDDLDRRDPIVRLHGLVAACEAKVELGVEDPLVLGAIAHHTLGRPGMSPLEQLVFVADWIEPGRPTHPGLAEVRELAYHSISRATRCVLDYTLRYLIDRGQVIHPIAVDTRNWFITNEDRRKI